jgi:hypothetical protein
MYIGLHVKYRLFLLDFKETWTFSIIYKKISSDIKFHENPFGERAELFQRTEGHNNANSRFSQICENA